MMDDKEIDVVDLEIDEYGVGRKGTTSGPAMRQGTLYGKSKTEDDFMRRFEQDKAIAEDLEQEKKNEPGRWWLTMNYELSHMKKLQKQRNRLLHFDSSKQKLEPGVQRCSSYMFVWCRGVFCDAQSVIFTLCALVGFVLWIWSVLIGVAPVEELSPITIQDVDPLPPAP